MQTSLHPKFGSFLSGGLEEANNKKTLQKQAKLENCLFTHKFSSGEHKSRWT